MGTYQKLPMVTSAECMETSLDKEMERKMKLNEGELRIYYLVTEGSNEILEKTLRKVLEKLGYRYWASGFSDSSGIRELQFIKE